MDSSPSGPGNGRHAPRRRWPVEKRAEALAAYYRTGSRRRARKETGVPERTLSVWLRDERHADERRAVQAGILREVEQDAARRGVELVEATREAILVCRRALRGNPDGRTASQLLTALTRARESEDRIRRLDEGAATSINGAAPSAAEREEFLEWKAEREARANVPVEEVLAGLASTLDEYGIGLPLPDTPGAVVALLRALAEKPGVLEGALAHDPALARALARHAAGAGADAATARAETPADDVSSDVGAGRWH